MRRGLRSPVFAAGTGLAIAGLLSWPILTPKQPPPTVGGLAARIGCSDLALTGSFLAPAREAGHCQLDGEPAEVAVFTTNAERDGWALAEKALVTFTIMQPARGAVIVGDRWAVAVNSQAAAATVLAATSGAPV
jgi:hypothetical protein